MIIPPNQILFCFLKKVTKFPIQIQIWKIQNQKGVKEVNSVIIILSLIK